MKIFNNPEIEKSLVNNFELVKEAVLKTEKSSRAGLMLGLQELGATLSGFIGAYFQVASNIIVVNTTPLRRIIETDKELLNPYGFHVLLHEYIHSLGYLDEEITKQKTYDITRKYYGEEHIATELSKDMKKYFPNLVYPIQGYLPPKGIPEIQLVKGFDKSSFNNYIT